MSTHNESTFANPWFTVSVGLFCVMIGWAMGTGFGDSVGNVGSNDVVAANDTAPAPAAAQQDEFPVVRGAAVDLEEDHIFGDPNAEISIIEYSDFECPYCQRHHPTMKQVLEEYDGQVNWIYRHFPLSFHPNAQPAAEASECVAKLGGNDAFWEFADKIFAGSPYLANITTYVSELGLDSEAFSACLESGEFTDMVQAQMQAGTRLGVTGTPGNIVYSNTANEGKLISGAFPFSSFVTVIDELLAAN